MANPFPTPLSEAQAGIWGDMLEDWANVEHSLTDGTHKDLTCLSITIPNTGLHILDTNASHDLIIKPGSDLTADKTLTLTTGDADRTVTLSGNPTLADWFDQSVKSGASPTFVDLSISSPSSIYSLNHDNFAGFVSSEHIDWTNASDSLLTTGYIIGKRDDNNLILDTPSTGQIACLRFRSAGDSKWVIYKDTNDLLNITRSGQTPALKIDETDVLYFGVHTAIGSETVTGYITIKDTAGNARKLAVVS